MTASNPMSNGRAEADRDPVLTDIWGSQQGVDIDPDCSPTKVCRNAREFSFDGIADGDDDLGSSWRKLLDREGKSGAGSLRDLIGDASASSADSAGSVNGSPAGE